MNNKNINNIKYIENEFVIKNAIDLSVLGVCFSSKPLIIGGLAMEYYGIRKKGNDVDFIVTNDDYEVLAEKYPNNRVDRWGDLYVSVDNLELLRSIYRLDYDFYSVEAIEYEEYKVISIEKLFFMKMLANSNQPEVEKHVTDFRLMWNYFLKTFQNSNYVAYAMEHQNQYVNVPNGMIYNGKYSAV
ncbi:hypothetical protein RBG61_11305 [Paludicola sp. MB14-C6]|uniref:hypothetical protein n=1 Tax=Paludihabitans sp. MB14-C6 TaxID=3070656 RepID=UPI0027DC0324|nr:hypothetical protein [Paludicola sp. MB14-C6]WMJ22569.1 hypothetical protein RBG61_11305 [Paludicola sp. MB14-C6]